jgi:hypothetical protein
VCSGKSTGKEATHRLLLLLLISHYLIWILSPVQTWQERETSGHWWQPNVVNVVNVVNVQCTRCKHWLSISLYVYMSSSHKRHMAHKLMHRARGKYALVEKHLTLSMALSSHATQSCTFVCNGT